MGQGENLNGRAFQLKLLQEIGIEMREWRDCFPSEELVVAWWDAANDEAFRNPPTQCATVTTRGRLRGFGRLSAP